MPRGRAISAISLSVLMGKTREKRQGKALYANMPVVATVFIGKWALISTFDSQKGGL